MVDEGTDRDVASDWHDDGGRGVDTAELKERGAGRGEGCSSPDGEDPTGQGRIGHGECSASEHFQRIADIDNCPAGYRQGANSARAAIGPTDRGAGSGYSIAYPFH